MFTSKISLLAQIFIKISQNRVSVFYLESFLLRTRLNVVYSLTTLLIPGEDNRRNRDSTSNT